MKRHNKGQTTGRMFVLCTGILAIFVFGGLVVSFRTASGDISNRAEFVSVISFDDASFLPCLKRAVGYDFVFCLAAFLFGGAFPVSLLTGGYILLKGFLIGSILGLAARYCAFYAAAKMIFVLFVSNVLILPLYILLFIISVKFSYNSCSLSPGDKTVRLLSFGVRVAVFFGLMCLAEVLQIGFGILVLK